jgi:hypothetical protein
MGGIGTNVGSGGGTVGDGGIGVHVDVGPRFIAVLVAVGIGEGREVPGVEQADRYIAVKSTQSHLTFGVKIRNIPLDIFR